MNEKSSMLWNKRLGHITIRRIEKLVNDGVLNSFDFTIFQTSVDCIMEKHTNKTNIDTKRSTSILQIIHLDICSPEIDSYSQKYFILFTNNYS